MFGHRRSLSRDLAAAGLLLVAALALSGEQASAQAYDGCFVGGQQVADSVCTGGGSGGASPMSSAVGAAMGTMGFALGAALGGMLLDALTADDNQNAQVAAQAAAANEAAAVQQANINRTAAAQAFAAEQRQQQQAFAQGKADLMRSVRPLGDGGDALQGDDLSPVVVDLGSNSALASTLQPRQLGDDDPHPVSRLDSDARNYPELGSYTQLQRDAHDFNDQGVSWTQAQPPDWQAAFKNFSAALNADPFGPFSNIIRDNLRIAGQHLDATRGASARPVAAAVVAKTAQAPKPPAKSVLPRTYADCNAQLQARTSGCSDMACFKPEYTRFQACVSGLTPAAVH